MSRPADPAVRGGALAVAAGALGLAVILAVPAAATTPTPGESWSAEIALEGGDDRGVVLTDGAVRLDGVPNGEVVLAPRRTLGLVDGIAGVPAADVPRGAAVVVEARGLGRDGRWGDWVRVPREGSADLGDPTGEIGIRILLRRADGGESPVLRGLWLTTTAAAPPTQRDHPDLDGHRLAQHATDDHDHHRADDHHHPADDDHHDHDSSVVVDDDHHDPPDDDHHHAAGDHDRTDDDHHHAARDHDDPGDVDHDEPGRRRPRPCPSRPPSPSRPPPPPPRRRAPPRRPRPPRRWSRPRASCLRACRSCPRRCRFPSRSRRRTRARRARGGART